jgi:hypothetical protein
MARTQVPSVDDQIIPAERLQRWVDISRLLSVVHERFAKETKPKWWEGSYRTDSDWEAEREWHNRVAEDLRFFHGHLLHCSNSRSNVEYNGADIAMPCQKSYIWGVKELIACSSQGINKQYDCFSIKHLAIRMEEDWK